MFVREPLHRMVSAYKNKFLQIPGYTKDIRKEIVKEFRPESYDPDGKNFVSFPEFIQYFSDNKTRNQHWRQYEKICHPCVIDYDFIGHYETLKEDAPLLLKMAGIKESAKFPPIHKSTSTAQVVDYSVPKSRLMLSKELENCTAVTLKCLATNTFAPLKNFWIREKRTRWTSYKSTRTEILDFLSVAKGSNF